MSNVKPMIKNNPMVKEIETSMDLTPEMIEKTNQLLLIPNIFEIVCSAVANGGSLTQLCADWGVRYYDVITWITSDIERNKTYNKSILARDEWFVSTLLRELQLIATADIKDMFDEHGSLKPIDDWPPGLSKCVEAIQVDEIWEGTGKDREQTGLTKRIKFNSKLKAIELLGKYLKMFIDRVELSGTVRTLEDLVVEAGGHDDGGDSNP